jgi:hypothetical protein
MNTLRAIFISTVLTGAASAAVDQGLLNLVMPDAKVLSGVQVDQTVLSPFGQYILNQIQPSDPGFLKFISTTGFDPRHDLREILAATSANTSALVLGRGTFQVAQIAGTAVAQGGTVTSYNGINIITGPGQGSGAVAFVDGNTAAIGDLASVQGVIDRRSATKPGADPALVQKAQDASVSNQAWFATNTPLSDFLSGKLGNANLNNLSQNNLFQSVLQASGGVSFASGGVVITGDAVTASTQNAQSLVDVLKFLVSMLPSNNAQLKSLADSASFAANGSVAHMSLSLTEQQAEQLFTSAPKKTAAARRR